MNIAHQTWIGQLPGSWKQVSLRDALAQRKELNTNREQENILSVTNDRGVINYKDKGNIGNKASEDIERYKKVYKGDIVANSMNVIIGSVGISPEDGALSPVYIVMKPNEGVDVRYYDYIFKAKGFQTQLRRIGYGILDHRMRIPWDNLKMQVLPMPPASEQKKVADFLDVETAKIDNLISKQERLLKLLEEKRRATIAHAVTRGIDPKVKLKETNIPWLGKIPTQWQVKKLKFLGVKRDIKVQISDEFKYIGLEHIEPFTAMELDKEGEAEVGTLALRYEKNDVLFGKLRPYLTKAFLTSEGGVCSSEFIVINCSSEIIPEYLLYIFLSTNFVEEVNSSTYGSKMPRANWEFIGNTTLPLPDKVVQRNITAYLNKSIGISEAIKLKIQEQITLLNERRTSLISHAVTGKIKV